MNERQMSYPEKTGFLTAKVHIALIDVKVRLSVYDRYMDNATHDFLVELHNNLWNTLDTLGDTPAFPKAARR